MIKEAIDRILQLAQNEVIKIGDRTYTTKQLYPSKDFVPPTIEVCSLTGLIDYIDGEVEYSDFSDNFIHVQRPNKVAFYEIACPPDQQRPVILIAECDYSTFEFNSFRYFESFIIELQSRFTETEDLFSILKIVGNLSEEIVLQQVDDGITQKTTVRKGVTRAAEVDVPRHVKLRPFRTFTEIIQPESNFLFRMRRNGTGIECGLFEADGGAWRLDAMMKIKEWLKERVPKGIPIIA